MRYNLASCFTPRFTPRVHAHHAISFSTVAWLKLFVDDTPRAHGVDWDAVVFGNGSRSICGGGGGPMHECRMDRGH